MKILRYQLVVVALSASISSAEMARGEPAVRPEMPVASALQPPRDSSRLATGAAAMLVLFLAGMMLRRQAVPH